MAIDRSSEPVFHLSTEDANSPRYLDLPVDVFAPLPERFHSPSSNDQRRIEDRIDGMEPISAISIPNSWKREIVEPGFGEVAKSTSFLPPDGDGTALALYDRGYPIAASEALQFQSILDKAPHKLTAAEIEMLNEQVLGTVGDRSAFNITSAKTKMINGRNVLTIDGEWREGGKKFHGMYLPKDESGRMIQEMYYEGQEPHFSRHYSDAVKAMEAVRWKPATDGGAQIKNAPKKVLPPQDPEGPRL